MARGRPTAHGARVITRAIPSNRLGRAEREARWAEAAEEGRRNQARPLEGQKDAKYVWQRFIADTKLPASAKLVAYTLTLYGNAAGENIFPGIRELERRSSLSGRFVTNQIDALIRQGWLTREARRSGKAWAMRVIYHLSLPLGAITDENAALLKLPKLRGAESASTRGADLASARAEGLSAPVTVR